MNCFRAYPSLYSPAQIDILKKCDTKEIDTHPYVLLNNLSRTRIPGSERFGGQTGFVVSHR